MPRVKAHNRNLNSLYRKAINNLKLQPKTPAQKGAKFGYALAALEEKAQHEPTKREQIENAAALLESAYTPLEIEIAMRASRRALQGLPEEIGITNLFKNNKNFRAN